MGTFKTTGLGGTYYVRFTSNVTEGSGRLLVLANPIPIVGSPNPVTISGNLRLASQPTGIPNNYSAPGYTGGTWNTILSPDYTFSPATGSATDFTTFTIGVLPITYTATNGGQARIQVTGTFNIYGPTMLSVGASGQVKVPAGLPAPGPGVTTTWVFSPPGIFSQTVVDARTLSITAIVPGTSTLTYTRSDGYTDTLTITATQSPTAVSFTPPPVDNSVTTTIPVVPPGSDGGSPITAVNIVDDDGSGATGDPTGIVIPMGTPPGTYDIDFTLTNASGTSAPATATVTVQAGGAGAPIAVDDNINTPFDSRVGGTYNVLANDDLNGGTFASGAIVSDDGATGISINPSGSLVVPTGVPPLAYHPTYTITTENGTSNVATINFGVTLGPDGSGNYTTNAMGIASVVVVTITSQVSGTFLVGPTPRTVEELADQVLVGYTGTQEAAIRREIANIGPALIKNGQDAYQRLQGNSTATRNNNTAFPNGSLGVTF